MSAYYCSEPGCGREGMARQLCNAHYKAHTRAGTLPTVWEQRPRRATRPAAEVAASLAARVATLDVALAIAHHHAGMLLERWGQMTSSQLHEHLLLLWQESAAGAVPDCEAAS